MRDPGNEVGKRSCVKETDDIMIPYNSKRNDSRYFPNEQPFPIATSGGSVFSGSENVPYMGRYNL